jgi:cytochrome c553
MKLVWMMIVMATGAMLLIAATLLVKPLELGRHSFYGSGNDATMLVNCVFCSASQSEGTLQSAQTY